MRAACGTGCRRVRLRSVPRAHTHCATARDCLFGDRVRAAARQENMPAMEEHCQQRERALSAVREGNGDTVCVEMEAPRGGAA